MAAEEGLTLSKGRGRRSEIARDIVASAVAIATYVIAALCAGWAVSILLAPMGYGGLRFAIEAAISTALGMLASRAATSALFPNRSGKVIFATFAGMVVLVSVVALNKPVNWLHTGQALLLVVLAYGMFWPHRRRAH